LSPTTEWLVALITTLAPLDRASPDREFPGWTETSDERLARYGSIAADLSTFVLDPETKPAFGGDAGRARTAALLLAIAYHESGFAKDVDLGPCYRGPRGRSSRCDSGMSACVLQIHLGNGKTPEGWTQADLFADRRKCFAAGLRLVRASLGACRHLPLRDRLSAYASGSCAHGAEASRALMDLAERLSTTPR
jgi:hypothetical protein